MKKNQFTKNGILHFVFDEDMKISKKEQQKIKAGTGDDPGQEEEDFGEEDYL